MSSHAVHDMHLHAIYSAPVRVTYSNNVDTQCPLKRPKRSSPKRSPSKLDPMKNVKTSTNLPSTTHFKWMEEARDLYTLVSMNLDLTKDPSPCSTMERQLEPISYPVVALEQERVSRSLVTGANSTHSMDCHANRVQHILHSQECFKQSLLLTRKKPPVVDAGVSQPMYARSKQGHKVVKYKARSPMRTSIDPILSAEMREKLNSHLEVKIKGNIWQNEVRSRLARPLSATTFCEREEQLNHHLSAARFVPAEQGQSIVSAATPRMAEPPIRFPFSAEAHAHTRQIAKCYRTMRFRAEVLAQVRLVAIAIRVLRRKFVPHFLKWHRERKAAVTCIQNCFRAHLQWHRAVLRPQFEAFVRSWVDEGVRRTRFKIAVVRALEQLFIARKKRTQEAIRRRLVLVRWCAKTKVCLFVHLVWCVRWFRKKRESNIQVMRYEAEAMEAIDLRKEAEFQTLFKTSMGSKLVKKELEAWRKRVREASMATAILSSDQISSVSLSGSSTPPGDEVALDASILRLRNSFSAFDLDGSGALDLDEFQLMISYLRADSAVNRSRGGGGASAKVAKTTKLTPAQIRDLFDDLDEDGNGQVARGEFERWWKKQRDQATRTTSSSASMSYLSAGLNNLVLESRGLLFWLLGKKQQLERKFVKNQMVKAAADAEKLSFLALRMQNETTPPIRRCSKCGRRFELLRDWSEHTKIGCSAVQCVVDTFVLKKWVREEEIRLLEDEDRA